ncbi:MAG: HigA family addiction module antitoxin [Rhodanobacteraceae bacterium]
MNDYPAIRNPERAPTHPGAILRDDVLPALGMSVSATARELHVSRQTLHELLAERKGFTPEMALRVGKLAGNGPELWLRMQGDFDLWHAGREMADELRSIHSAEVTA